MAITQTVDIPDNRLLTIKVPNEVPTGQTILIFKPVNELTVNIEEVSTEEALGSARKILKKHLPAFEALAK